MTEPSLMTHQGTRVDVAALVTPLVELRGLLTTRNEAVAALTRARRAENHALWRAVASLVVDGQVTMREVARELGVSRRLARRAVEAHRDAT